MGTLRGRVRGDEVRLKARRTKAVCPQTPCSDVSLFYYFSGIEMDLKPNPFCLNSAGSTQRACPLFGREQRGSETRERLCVLFIQY